MLDFWNDRFPAVYGRRFEQLRGGFQAKTPQSPPFTCAGKRQTYEDLKGNAFYCGGPNDDYIAYDAAQLFPQLNNEFGGIAPAVVLAHEMGHAIQRRAEVEAASVVTELQADCFAGSGTPRRLPTCSDDNAVVLVKPGACSATASPMHGSSVRGPIGVAPSSGQRRCGGACSRGSAPARDLNGASSMDGQPPVLGMCVIRWWPRFGRDSSTTHDRRRPSMVDPHLTLVRPVRPRTAEGCEECLKLNSPWVHLRLCLSCGHVGCCDSSPLRHARAHAAYDGHPIVQSFEPGENWRWCYFDEAFV